jgi:hypothetical protein
MPVQHLSLSPPGGAFVSVQIGITRHDTLHRR